MRKHFKYHFNTARNWCAAAAKAFGLTLVALLALLLGLAMAVFGWCCRLLPVFLVILFIYWLFG